MTVPRQPRTMPATRSPESGFRRPEKIPLITLAAVVVLTPIVTVMTPSPLRRATRVRPHAAPRCQ